MGEEEPGGGGPTPKGLCTKVGKKIKESGPKVFLRAHSSPSKSGNDIFRQSLSLLSQFFLPKFAGVREHEFKGVGETKEERRVDALSPLSHLAWWPLVQHSIARKDESASREKPSRMPSYDTATNVYCAQFPG